MKFTDLPRRHCDLTEAVTRRPGVLPSQCRGMTVRVDSRHDRIGEDDPPFFDFAHPMEGRPDRPAPIRLRKCLACGSTPVLEECRDAKGQTYFFMRNDPPEDRGPFPPTGPEPLAVTA